MFKVDNDKCLRCGMCTGIAPDVFEFNDDGEIKVNNNLINEDNIEDVNTAKKTCPANAIEKVDTV